MKITKIENLPVFEIQDIDFGNLFNIDNSDFNWYRFFQNESDPNSYRERTPLINEYEEFAKSLFVEINKQVNIIVKESNFEWWPKDYVDNYSFEINENVGTGIYKDSPNFNMGVHVDNGLSFGTCILNLKDNIGAHTIYYTDYSGNKFIYKGPEKMGSGILHINQPTLYHSGINNSDTERFFLMTYYKVIGVK